ncbi:MaoC family dehydratase N-terminal domain-containing protein [Salicibibacter cibi]|uniref:MaoC family dehydratase N-terminal domain-containing protein n=1 Tax=Salicibibacter cibi TaxID=2743001 RepID=A0A7T6ZAR7_9BACI|nr:MaoC family dehydratase N-terminal domain-containing protein [Salicibibacter cibi]QQK79987.1 MaoC family dehydratase N-terminal domain-containing protein [Salicibibacter cibi]
MPLKLGEVITFERSFTNEDVELFTKLSLDEGSHHVIPDEQGRLVIQGLLTATLPTKIGGDNNVLARNMTFDFRKPVYTGDTIRCEVTIDELKQKENGRTSISASFVCFNQDETKVLTGTFAGVIL